MALDNVRHESFAQKLAQNIEKQVAYKEVYPNVSDSSASVCASNLIKNNPDITVEKYFLGLSLEQTYSPIFQDNSASGW